ncbi:hypothetical protein A9320_20585 [Ruegeria sp. PBVC088]|nr:hypothetical protein A9320_20585 [Ruegeria sp. PBVC088]
MRRPHEAPENQVLLRLAVAWIVQERNQGADIGKVTQHAIAVGDDAEYVIHDGTGGGLKKLRVKRGPV